MPTVDLNEEFLRNLPPPPETGFAYFMDSDPRHSGFGLRLFPSGKAKFVARGRVKGKSRTVTLKTRVHHTRLKAAITEALRELEYMAGGGDRNAEYKATLRERKKAAVSKKGWTLRQVMEDRIQHRTKHKLATTATLKGFRRVVEKYLSDYLDTPIAEIGVEDLMAVHATIQDRVVAGEYIPKKGKGHRSVDPNATGRVTANQAIRAFKSAWRHARDIAGVPDLPIACPVQALELENPEDRETYLRDVSELPAFWSACEKLRSSTSDVDRSYGTLGLLLLTTGLRARNGMGLRWEWIDQAARTLTIPSIRMKNRRKRLDLPLTDFHIRLLEDQFRNIHPTLPASMEIKFAEATTPWVFPSYGTKGSNGPMHDPRRLWARCQKHGGPERLTHDLRRTYGGACELAGIPEPIARALMHHTAPAGVHWGYKQQTLTADRLRPYAEAVVRYLQDKAAPRPKIDWSGAANWFKAAAA